MRQRAFTLVEVLLVILLLGLLVVFAFPDLGQEMKRRSLVESADRLRSLIVMMHAKAMQDGVRYRIEFPGTPDPLDVHAEKSIDVPVETQQPIVKKQSDPLNNPEAYADTSVGWQAIMQEGSRCVAVMNWNAGQYCEISNSSPVAGPQVLSDERTSFVPLTLNPDGTCDKVAFALTDLPPDKDLTTDDVSRILYVIVDGRTGQTWIQRAWRVEECEVMAEYGASPILRMDFTRPDLITDKNILEPPKR